MIDYTLFFITIDYLPLFSLSLFALGISIYTRIV
jgi:hypothetical protein